MSSYAETRKIDSIEKETILVYGVLVLLVGGGIGVYFPLLLDRSISAESLATYVLASLAPLGTDMLLPEKYWKDISKRERMRIGAACGMAALCSFAALIRNEKSMDITLSTLAVILILGIYYHVSVLSGKFRPDVPPTTEDGGPDQKLVNLAGEGLQ